MTVIPEITKATESLPTPKLRRIEPHIDTSGTQTRIKAWIGRFYVNYVKPIAFMRRLVISLWQSLHPVYINCTVPFDSSVDKHWRPLIKLGNYVEAENIPTITVLDSSKVDTPAPEVFPTADQAYLSSPHDHYDFPPVYVARIDNALVYGGTNMVFAQGIAICHDLYDFERDYTSEELHGRHSIDVENRRMRLLHSDDAPERVPVAAVFVDACAPNYAHWLTEVLPRIAAFCSNEQFKNIPLIINEGLHYNIMQSLFLIVGEEREVITLPIGRAVQADSLYVTSVAGYVPFERRNDDLPNHSQGLFCPSAFDLIREHVFSFTDQLSSQYWPKKIYLRRNSEIRKVTNAKSLEKILVDQGYVVISPEMLSFPQQAMLFKAAEEIVASSGAALANLIFSPSNVHAQILIGRYSNTSYWYWQNIACASGKSVSYVLGELKEKNDTIHSDFEVDLTAFSREVETS